MSSLEGAAGPILRGVLSLQHTTSAALNVRDAELIALWAVKTAIVRNLATNYRKVVPKEHFRFVYQHRRPPPNVFVDLALCPSHSGLSARQSQSVVGLVQKGDEADVYARSTWLYNIVLAIGPLLLRIVHLPLDGYVLLSNLEELGSARRIHPPEGGAVRLDVPVFGMDLKDFEASACFRFAQLADG